MAWAEGTCQGPKEGKMPRSSLLVPTEQQLEVLGQPLRSLAHSQSRVGFTVSMREASTPVKPQFPHLSGEDVLCGSLV